MYMTHSNAFKFNMGDKKEIIYILLNIYLSRKTLSQIPSVAGTLNYNNSNLHLNKQFVP